MIGDEIEIKFLKMNDDRSLSIGINAPKDFEIHRKEVYKVIQKKKACTQQAHDDSESVEE